ncbi:MAG: Rrf2 family transcriptional regulator [Alphaproteobacteria bacterium]|nr:Rrf2 family transcriptional regulator [Alphaproteobacteria bacterium]
MIKLTRKMLYALEAVVDIAYNSSADPTQAREIAKRQGIPQRYLEQVMQKLVRAGVLKGVRGPRGGYRLARERRRITVGEILRVVYSTELTTRDLLNMEPGSDLAEKVIRPLWRDVRESFMRKINTITIEDLCQRAHAKGVDSRTAERVQFDI